ncbi:MAG TPA: hypothetical protein VFW40_02865 [Capsulimonadaceae bacterium]|nr:hypothetical protein [Capsulimonadaceae bacterium]
MSDVSKTLESSGELKKIADSLMARYGRSGPGRASALRLLGAYVVYKEEGVGGLRRLGFSRDSVLLYLDKMRDAGLLHAES